MNARNDYIKVFALSTLVLAILVFAHTAGQMLSAAPTDQPGIKDPALATLDTNEKLSQIVEEFKTLNAKTQAVHDLLKSGRVEIVVRQSPAAAAAEVGEK